ncbi:recombinase family protein [Rahnella sp. CJA17(1/100)]|uniref:recombinase family protein n=1 Tax=Rahnella sp. CJA17(1/100) TaxID=2508951 RepID=UPI00106F40AA|nr:recombinase family protein [Rahnella sp. CJA17(1/100)]
MNNQIKEKQKVNVVQYLRMSTDHQIFSVDNQAEFISKYAQSHNMEIIGTYDDRGKSGISADGRDSFNKLIQDVVTHTIKIAAVLVYDVSRFGRFQDNDEAGHYSFLLKLHGVKVIYCAENLPEESPEIQMLTLPALRYAAGAYSRNLSIKVFAGHVNLVKRGYFQGGMPGYGLHRKLVDSNNSPKMILSHGERKSLQTDRVILVPGEEKELEIIRLIFNMFIFDSYNEYIIANKLNELGYRNKYSQWTRSNVHQILINERYTGKYIYNKTSSKLKSKRIKNPEENWVQYMSAFEPIISIEKFNMAQDIIKNRSLNVSNEQILSYLSKKLKSNGKLSGVIIDEDDTGPSSSIVASRFGGLLRAYKLIGYTPERDYSYIEINESLREMHSNVINDFFERLENVSLYPRTDEKKKQITINDSLKLSLILSRCHKLKSGKFRWVVRFESNLKSDFNIIVRMNSSNSEPVDYYILPSIESFENEIKIKENNPLLLELYRFDDIEFFFKLLMPLTTEKAA